MESSDKAAGSVGRELSVSSCSDIESVKMYVVNVCITILISKACNMQNNYCLTTQCQGINVFLPWPLLT